MPDTPSNIVRPDASQYAAGATMPAGWHRTGDDYVDERKYLRVATYAGVRTSQGAALDAILSFYSDYLFRAYVSPSVATCEIKAEYSTSMGSNPGDNERTVSSDTYRLTPVPMPTALEAHPAFAAVRGAVMAIDDALAHGDSELAASAAGMAVAAQKYLALRLAGVTQWDPGGYLWTVVRHYSTLADVGTIAADAAAASGSVFAWGNVEGSYMIFEPKYVVTDANGQALPAASYEWRLAGVSVVRTDTALELEYTYQAAWKWAAALYPGGSWTPALPS